MEIQQDENFGKFHYNRGKIYKLCCKDANITDIYVGSTLNHYRRKNLHKHHCNNPKSIRYNFPVYKFMRDHGGFDNWDIIVLEEYAAENKNDLLWKEREWIENLKPSLNTLKPIVSRVETKERDKKTKKKYYEKNKEKILEQKKEYTEKNKEQIRDQRKEYREKNKEKISERRKEHYEANKQKLSEKSKEYRENNKEKISEKIECEICKVSIRRDYMSKHKKSQKHINNLEQKSIEP